MSAQVRFVLPTNWSTVAKRDLTGLGCAADTLGEALSWLANQCPEVADRVLDPQGKIPRCAVVAVDDQRVSTSEGLEYRFTNPEHEVTLLSAFMGVVLSVIRDVTYR